jgi:glycosyltransferase involved in cell wall biosynthesis
LRGAKVILDLHDPMPELFRTLYSLPEKHFVVRWLKIVEKWSIGFAHLALTPNLAFKELFTARSCRPGKMHTVMNSPDTTIFNPKKFAPRKFNGEKPFTLMYHGLLVERHGLDVAVRAAMRLRRRIPNIKLNMYGERTDYLERIMEHVWRTSMDRHVEFHGYLPLPEIAENIMNIDLGIIPNRLSAFTEINFPTRIFEYLAMNKPVIVPGTLGIRDYFNEDEILYFEPDNPDDLAKKIEWAWTHPDELQQVLERGRKVYERNCWDVQKEKFAGLVGNLFEPAAARAKAMEAKKSFA